jgi:hypothetical protein
MNESAHPNHRLPTIEAAPIGYREYKLLLRADHFDKPTQFHRFWKLTRRIAHSLDIDILKRGKPMETHLREVLFFDTPKFRLYNNNFMLRRRTFYNNGLQEAEHELTLKYRSHDRDAAAVLDLRPAASIPHVSKFKEEVLVDPAEAGAMRFIYSHSAEMMTRDNLLTGHFSDFAKLFPTLLSVGAKPTTTFGVVNDVAIEEVLVNMGEIVFGAKTTAKATLAVWRHRRTQEHLLGEYSYQVKYADPSGMHPHPKALSEQFFSRLQIDAADWLHHGTTKTAMVYSLGRVAINHHE